MKWALSALALSASVHGTPQWGENEAEDSLITKLRQATADHTEPPIEFSALLRGRRRNRNRNRRPKRPIRTGPSLVDVLNVISATSEYGCWCSSKTTWNKAHGEPLDEIDELCKGYVQNMRCVTMDMADAGVDDCNVMKTRYVTKGIDFFDLENLTYDTIVAGCKRVNDDPCAQNVCIVDVAMIPVVYSLLKNNKEFMIDPDFDHNTGEFDKDGYCTVLSHLDGDDRGLFGDYNGAPEGGDGGDSLGSSPASNDLVEMGVATRTVECCGSQPLRKPYKVMGGTRQCCVNTPYDSTKFTCCADGSVGVSCA